LRKKNHLFLALKFFIYLFNLIQNIMEFPNNLKYTSDHEWIRVEGDHAYVGITAFAQGELGDIVYVDISSEGETLKQGDAFGSVEAVKTVADLYMPVSGEIVEVNSGLNDEPESVNNDPYGKGWMVKIKLTDSAELDGLMDVDVYRSSINA
jgi:glycine cleavage system H protein